MGKSGKKFKERQEKWNARRNQRKGWLSQKEQPQRKAA